MTIIYGGITGYAGHGKNTVADMITSITGVKQYAFAEPIKVLVHDCFNGAYTYESRDFKEKVQSFTCCTLKLKSYCKDYYKDLYNILKGFPDFKEEGYQIWFTSSWRILYQTIGTEWARQCIYQNYWIDKAPNKSVIITDVRGYGDDPENVNAEADFIIGKGGWILEVYDPRKADKKVNEHSSEVGIDKDRVDYTIINDGSLEDLRNKVEEFVEEFIYA